MAVSHIVGNLSELVSRFVSALTSISLKLTNQLVPVLDVYPLAIKRAIYNTTSVSIGATGWVYFYNNSRKALLVKMLRFWTNSGSFTFNNFQIAGRDLYTYTRPYSSGAMADTAGHVGTDGTCFRLQFCKDFVLEPGWSIGVYVNSWTGADTIRQELLVEEWDT